MPKYMIHASYTAEGAKGLQKEGAAKRRSQVQSSLKSAGGKLEAFYFAVGEADVVSIVDVPDLEAAVALSIAINASGAVRLRTIPLLTVEEMDGAIKKTISYRAPGV